MKTLLCFIIHRTAITFKNFTWQCWLENQHLQWSSTTPTESLGTNLWPYPWCPGRPLRFSHPGRTLPPSRHHSWPLIADYESLGVSGLEQACSPLASSQPEYLFLLQWLWQCWCCNSPALNYFLCLNPLRRNCLLHFGWAACWISGRTVKE